MRKYHGCVKKSSNTSRKFFWNHLELLVVQLVIIFDGRKELFLGCTSAVVFVSSFKLVCGSIFVILFITLLDAFTLIGRFLTLVWFFCLCIIENAFDVTKEPSQVFHVVADCSDLGSDVYCPKRSRLCSRR